MKQYNIVPTYQECLKICETSKEFSHSVQTIDGKEIHSFKYNLSIPDMWEIDDAMDGRLNMRGIVFIDEKIVALPFPKFFNLGEVKYTKDLDMTKIKFANEKIDGSLISVFKLNGKFYCKSMKSIESDVSKESQKYFDNSLNIRLHAFDKISRGLSPMYEYVSSTCKIVIDYGKSKMFYLGSRDMKTGEIHYPNESDALVVDAPCQFFDSEEINKYLKTSNVEGVVVTLEDGQMVKLKTEEYCKLHRIVSNFSDKNIIESIIDKTYDDLIGQLQQNNLNEYKEKAFIINENFWNRYRDIEEYVTERFDELNLKYSTRKEIAMHMQFSSMIVPWSHAMIFKLLDKRPIKELIFKRLREEFSDKTVSG